MTHFKGAVANDLSRSWPTSAAVESGEGDEHGIYTNCLVRG